MPKFHFYHSFYSWQFLINSNDQKSFPKIHQLGSFFSFFNSAMFFHPTIHTFFNLFLRFLLEVSFSRFRFSKRLRWRNERRHDDDYLFRTLRFGGSTRCVSFSLSSHFYVKRRRIELRNEWNNEKQQNLHTRNEIMIQSEAQNREPYNNKITLCISYFSSLYPSETVAETTRQSDSPSIVLKTSFSVLSDGSLRIRLIPPSSSSPDTACHMPSPRERKRMKSVSMSEDAPGQRLVSRALPLTWQPLIHVCELSYQKTFAQIIILCKKWVTSCSFNWSVKEISLNAIV